MLLTCCLLWKFRLSAGTILSTRVRSGALDRKAAGMQRGRFMLDISAGDIEVYSVTEDHFATAERLIGRHSFLHRLRTLDALQLAVALDLSDQGLLDQFVVADRLLGELASVEGLKVVNPETP
jgi:hypothetical protein